MFLEFQIHKICSLYSLMAVYLLSNPNFGTGGGAYFNPLVLVQQPKVCDTEPYWCNVFSTLNIERRCLCISKLMADFFADELFMYTGYCHTFSHIRCSPVVLTEYYKYEQLNCFH